jgi:hypothetical protein
MAQSSDLPLFITHSGDRFKPYFDIAPCDISASSVSGPRIWHANASRVGRSRRATRSLRSAHRQFFRRVARQFLWPRRFAGVLHRRRHFGPGVSRWAFLRRLRRLSRLDRWILLRIDRHVAHFPEFRSDVADPTASIPQGSAELPLRRAPAWCCCGSCRSRHSRVRACRRCSPPATRRATDARSPPRAATAMAAPP